MKESPPYLSLAFSLILLQPPATLRYQNFFFTSQRLSHTWCGSHILKLLTHCVNRYENVEPPSGNCAPASASQYVGLKSHKFPTPTMSASQTEQKPTELG